ncbi:MAG: biotin--[acetyl-CoA-carboxylase] ligase [Terrimicrobiaceae bacterium]|nr:biotin--[acetyl-CoA-carboxylase] ligase [Terrimicrobiaceae bacterium]
MTGLEGHAAVLGAAGWRVQFVDEASSTNDLARGLPAWSAVAAAVQTRGRGRFGRSFSSGAGGLWFTAVVPAPPPAGRGAGFSLALGWKLLELLERIGVPGARLRWPNDLMAGDRKLAGLLVEQTGPQTLAAGIGCNVRNRPWEDDPALEATAARLADLLPGEPEPEDLLPAFLDAVAEAHEAVLSLGLRGVVEALNPRWGRRHVVLHLHDGAVHHGVFFGLDPEGHLVLENEAGFRQTFTHPMIERLEEIPTRL